MKKEEEAVRLLKLTINCCYFGVWRHTIPQVVARVGWCVYVGQFEWSPRINGPEQTVFMFNSKSNLVQAFVASWWQFIELAFLVAVIACFLSLSLFCCLFIITREEEKFF